MSRLIHAARTAARRHDEPMLPALICLLGVTVGVLLTSSLSASRERRDGRVDALSSFVAANARVLVAHEQLYELVANGRPPEIESPAAQAALGERAAALAEWRIAHGRVLILVPYSVDLDVAVDQFKGARAEATQWVREYQRLGTEFELSAVRDSELHAWKAMHRAQDELIAASRGVVANDLKLLLRLINPIRATAGRSKSTR